MIDDVLVTLPPKGSQCETLLLALDRGEKLTVLGAIHKYGVYALSQRCGELRRMGWQIKSEMVTLPSGKRVAQYSKEAA